MYAVWKCKHLVGACTYVKYYEYADFDNNVLFTSILKRIENKILKNIYIYAYLNVRCYVVSVLLLYILNFIILEALRSWLNIFFWLLMHQIEGQI